MLNRQVGNLYIYSETHPEAPKQPCNDIEEEASEIYDMMQPGNILVIHVKSEDEIIAALQRKGLVLMELQARMEVCNA